MRTGRSGRRAGSRVAPARPTKTGPPTTWPFPTWLVPGTRRRSGSGAPRDTALRDRSRPVFEQPQAVLELRDTQVKLVPLVAGDEAELPERALNGGARALAEPD